MISSSEEALASDSLMQARDSTSQTLVPSSSLSL
nr:MAG TPA: hypothetical protein [Caudoviricetes sp.]